MEPDDARSAAYCLGSALIALGERPDAPVIASAEGSIGPWARTEREERELAALADELLDDLR